MLLLLLRIDAECYTARAALNAFALMYAILGIRNKVLSSKLYLFLINIILGDLLASIAYCISSIRDMAGITSIPLSLAVAAFINVSYFSVSAAFFTMNTADFL